MILNKENNGEVTRYRWPNCAENAGSLGSNLSPLRGCPPSYPGNGSVAGPGKRSADCRTPQAHVENAFGRLGALTSETLAEGPPGAWLSELHDQLSGLLADLCANEMIEGVERLAYERRPDLLPAMDGLTRRKAGLMAQLCDVLYLLNHSGPAGLLSRPWLCRRVRSFLNAADRFCGDCTLLQIEVMWHDLGGEG